MSYYSHIIWDFNGTLLDDVDAGIRSINTLLNRRGMRPIASAEEYRTLFHFPIKDYYRSLGFDFDKEPYEKLAVEWVAEYHREAARAALQPDAVELLHYTKERNFRQILLSATELQMLRRQTDALCITKFFHLILGLDNIHAASKIELALTWKEQEQPHRMLLIGDTDHDADTARALGADCILTAIGHQSAEHLKSCGAQAVTTSLKDLYPYIR